MDANKIKKPIHLREQVYSRVKRALLNGFYKQGERVTEVEVASQLGVSRTPVREALRMLAELGFLETRESGGYRVPLLDEENIVDLIDIRLLLEPQAMRMAIESRTQDQLDELTAALDEVREMSRAGDTIEFFLALLPFWSTFWSMSHSAGMIACLTKLTEQYHYQYISAMTLSDEAIREELLEFLQQINDCIVARNEEKGVALIEKHLEFKKSALLAEIEMLSEQLPTPVQER